MKRHWVIPASVAFAGGVASGLLLSVPVQRWAGHALPRMEETCRRSVKRMVSWAECRYFSCMPEAGEPWDLTDGDVALIMR